VANAIVPNDQIFFWGETMRKEILLCTALLLVFTIIGLSGCGGGDSEESAKTLVNVDNNKNPEILYTFPKDGQVDIAHDERITINFSEPINKDKFWSNISFIPSFDMSKWTASWTGNEVKICPPIGPKPFELNSEYTLVIPERSVVDLFGNSMVASSTITFRTLRYPVEVVSGGMNLPAKITPLWLFSVGKTGGYWMVVWGGDRDPKGPVWSTPGGTITASADGHIEEGSIKTESSEGNYPVTTSVSNGDGNSLTFSTATQLVYTMKFATTSTYLTFDLRSSGTVAKEFVYIGAAFSNPSSTPFILEAK